MKLCALIALFLLFGCATFGQSRQVLTVSQVRANYQQLDGKVIWIEGVVTECGRLGCPLQASAENKWTWIGIGSSNTFGKAVVPFLGKRIVVEGRLRGDCLRPTERALPNGQVEVSVCVDRASALMEPKIIEVRS